MDLLLVRDLFEEDGVFGKLFDEDGEKIAVTLEHAYPHEFQIMSESGPEDMIEYLPKIPPGVYTCERYMSPKHGYEVFRLLSVPGSDYDEIHIGNYNEDSDGCILVGASAINIPSGREILASRLTFAQVMKLQQDVNQFQLTVKDKE